MSIYKRIKRSDISITDIEVYKSFSLDSASSGIFSFQYRSGSFTDAATKTYDTSGSYWNSLLVNYYLSGSDESYTNPKYNSPIHTLGQYSTNNPQHMNKFHSSGSLVSISQQLFGEQIKEGSVTLTTDLTTLKDDGHGNLYSTNLTHTSSADTSISSSLNYKGNIFYSTGLITITETGSYGNTTYTDLTTGSYSLSFKSVQTIYVKEYKLTVQPNEFNLTSNVTATNLISGSRDHKLRNRLTGSHWGPCVTTIGLYSDDDTDFNRPLMIARLAKPIKMRHDIPITFTIRQDI